jgi:hypothetical protein
MTVEEMIEKYLCPGCVAGSDTKCGSFKKGLYGPESTEAGIDCQGHVLGTVIFPAPGNISLGMPKGFNRPGWCQMEKRPHNGMSIFCWPKGTFIPDDHFDDFNVPVWALEFEGDLFIRVAQPRSGMFSVFIIEEGKVVDVCPMAIDMTSKFDTYD